ncbi:MAG: PilN domain-containing protein [Deltaproteobacteria bacterium]|nr:PilN domain-containing protein [Deltaproteobacteria bacterium]
MIRINLLPVRAARKKETQRFQFTVAGLVTVLVVIISLGVYVYVRNESGALSTQVASDKKELEDLAKKIGELSKIEEEKSVVKEKLDTIKKLEDAKVSSIRLFQVLSTAMTEKMWLSSIKDTGATIMLKGYAADEGNIAEYVRRLSLHTQDIGTPSLVVAHRVTEAETKVEVFDFEITIARPVVEKKVDIDKLGRKKPSKKSEG